MKEYEQISEDCKTMWKENFKLTTEKYKQVSGYVFNEKNQLLIVKNGETYLISGEVINKICNNGEVVNLSKVQTDKSLTM